MKRALFGLVVVGLVIVPLGCNPFAPDQTVMLDVSNLAVPSTISGGSALTVTLTVVTGGCTSFTRIVAERSGSAASLTALGRNSAKGRPDIACPADIRFEPHSYELDPPAQGAFRVEARRPQSDPLSATVQVQ